MLAIVQILIFSAAQAETYHIVNESLETEVRAVTLPGGPNSTLLLMPCGKCEMKRLTATATTKWTLSNDRVVTLADFRNAIAGKPEAVMTVVYSVKTQELVRVSANVSVKR